jgi:hypothetical protein
MLIHWASWTELMASCPFEQPFECFVRCGAWQPEIERVKYEVDIFRLDFL